MKIVAKKSDCNRKSKIRARAQLVAVAGVALLLLACSDSEPTSDSQREATTRAEPAREKSLIEVRQEAMNNMTDQEKSGCLTYARIQAQIASSMAQFKGSDVVARELVEKLDNERGLGCLLYAQQQGVF